MRGKILGLDWLGGDKWLLRIQLTREQREELEQLSRQIGRVGPRAHMVLLSEQGKRVSEIAQIHEVSVETVRTWLHRYQSWGVQGLEGLPRGRPQSN